MERQKKVKSEDKPEDKKEPKRRGLSKWTLIQWILIPLLLIAALGGGLVVGYVVLGKKSLAMFYNGARGNMSMIWFLLHNLR